jgi:hypothetical protein
MELKVAGLQAKNKKLAGLQAKNQKLCINPATMELKVELDLRLETRNFASTLLPWS